MLHVSPAFLGRYIYLTYINMRNDLAYTMKYNQCTIQYMKCHYNSIIYNQSLSQELYRELDRVTAIHTVAGVITTTQSTTATDLDWSW